MPGQVEGKLRLLLKENSVELERMSAFNEALQDRLKNASMQTARSRESLRLQKEEVAKLLAQIAELNAAVEAQEKRSTAVHDQANAAAAATAQRAADLKSARAAAAAASTAAHASAEDAEAAVASAQTSLGAAINATPVHASVSVEELFRWVDHFKSAGLTRANLTHCIDVDGASLLDVVRTLLAIRAGTMHSGDRYQAKMRKALVTALLRSIRGSTQASDKESIVEEGITELTEFARVTLEAEEDMRRSEADMVKTEVGSAQHDKAKCEFDGAKEKKEVACGILEVHDQSERKARWSLIAKLAVAASREAGAYLAAFDCDASLSSDERKLDEAPRLAALAAHRAALRLRRRAALQAAMDALSHLPTSYKLAQCQGWRDGLTILLTHGAVAFVRTLGFGNARSKGAVVFADAVRDVLLRMPVAIHALRSLDSRVRKDSLPLRVAFSKDGAGPLCSALSMMLALKRQPLPALFVAKLFRKTTDYECGNEVLAALLELLDAKGKLKLRRSKQGHQLMLPRTKKAQCEMIAKFLVAETIAADGAAAADAEE